MRRVLIGIAAVAFLIGCGDQAAASLDAPTSGPCAGIPVISPDNPPDSLPLTPDRTLEQKFPGQIDGQPVNDVSSGRYIETLCMLDGEASVIAALPNLPAGVSLGDINVASARAAVDGLAVTVTAYRVPGGSGGALIPVIGILSGSVGGQSRFTGDLTRMTVGGKQVLVWTDAADGSTSYLYWSGDTLWVLEAATPSQAGKVLSALL